VPLSSKKSNQTVLSPVLSYRYMYYICSEKSLKISKGLLRQNAMAKNKKNMLISHLCCFLSATTEGFTLLHLIFFIVGSPFQLQLKLRMLV
jgi:hypothetical protein